MFLSMLVLFVGCSDKDNAKVNEKYFLIKTKYYLFNQKNIKKIIEILNVYKA